MGTQRRDAGGTHSGRAAGGGTGSPWILPALLALGSVGITVGSAPAHFAPFDLAVVAALLSLLALTLCGVTQAAARLGVIPALLASLLPSAALVLQLHQQAMVLGGRLAFPLAILAGAVPCAILLVRSRRALRFGRSLALAAVAAGALAAGCAAAHAASETLRWHLLYHVRVLGVPTYLALGTPVEPILDGLWSAGREALPVAPTVDSSPGGETPDLVLVLVDTLRADALAAYGGDPDLMPRLNALADASLVLGSLSANATYTKSSVASMFTGLLAEEHGAVDHLDRLPEVRVTLAEVLRRRGYETAAFVSNYANVGRRIGFAQGFDHFDEVEAPGQPYARAEQMNDRIERWLAARERRGPDSRRGPDGKPLFLYLHYMDPHAPYLSGWPEPGRHPSALRRGYDAELAYTDTQVAGAIERLKGTLGPETVFVFVSDHGEEFGEHGSHGHGHALYREILDVPALVHRADGPRGRVETRLEGRDLFELVLFLARYGPDRLAEWAAARSREARYASQYIIRKPNLRRPDRWFTVMRSLEDGERQLIWSAYGPTEEIYDLRDDPGQRRNLRAGRGDEAAALRERFGTAVSGWAAREVGELDSETEDLLKELGYLE